MAHLGIDFHAAALSASEHARCGTLCSFINIWMCRRLLYISVWAGERSAWTQSYHYWSRDGDTVLDRLLSPCCSRVIQLSRVFPIMLTIHVQRSVRRTGTAPSASERDVAGTARCVKPSPVPSCPGSSLPARAVHAMNHPRQ